MVTFDVNPHPQEFSLSGRDPFLVLPEDWFVRLEDSPPIGRLLDDTLFLRPQDTQLFLRPSDNEVIFRLSDDQPTERL